METNEPTLAEILVLVKALKAKATAILGDKKSINHLTNEQ